MDGFSFPLVFGAGVLSFLSPCVLPLVPPYLTYMSGSSFDQLRADGATAGVIWQKSVFTSSFFILGLYLLGLAYTSGRTPCSGPVPAAILSVAAVQDTAWQGAGLLGIYSLGLGVPFLHAGIAIGPFLTFFASFRKQLGTVERIMGVLLILTGLLFLTGQFTRLSYWFLETFPILQSFG